MSVESVEYIKITMNICNGDKVNQSAKDFMSELKNLLNKFSVKIKEDFDEVQCLNLSFIGPGFAIQLEDYDFLTYINSKEL